MGISTDGQVLRIEPGEAAEHAECVCCGSRRQQLSGLVFHEGSAHAVYLAGYCEGQRDRGLCLTVSIGDWSHGSNAEDRIAVGFHCRLVPRDDQREVQFFVAEPAETLGHDAPFVGTILPAGDANAHPHLGAFLDVARAVMRDDERARTYLKELSDPPGSP